MPEFINSDLPNAVGDLHRGEPASILAEILGDERNGAAMIGFHHQSFSRGEPLDYSLGHDFFRNRDDFLRHLGINVKIQDTYESSCFLPGVVP